MDSMVGERKNCGTFTSSLIHAFLTSLDSTSLGSSVVSIP